MEQHPKEHPSFQDLDAEWQRRVAAEAAGHDPDTETGRSEARHDFRYWDALGAVA